MEDEKEPQRIKYGERGQGSLVKMEGSKNWHSVIWHKGREQCRSLETDDLALAKKRHQQLLDERAVAKHTGRRYLPPAAERLTLGEILDSLLQDFQLRGVKSLRNARATLKPAREYFGDVRAIDVDADALASFVKHLQAQQYAPATINNSVQLIIQAYRLAQKHERLNRVPPATYLKVSNARQGFFPRAEVEALCEHLPSGLADMTLFGFLTGWRSGEIKSLTWAEVDLNEAVIRLPGDRSKNGEGRVLPLEGELLELIKRRHAQRSEGGKIIPWVFTYRGTKVGDVRVEWQVACGRIGLPGRLFHDLRRSAVRAMEQAGVPRSVAMKISGHKTESIYRRYAIVSEQDIRNALSKLSQHTSSQPKSRTVIPLNPEVPRESQAQ